jgi:hypothetical protein
MPSVVVCLALNVLLCLPECASCDPPVVGDISCRDHVVLFATEFEALTVQRQPKRLHLLQVTAGGAEDGSFLGEKYLQHKVTLYPESCNVY